MATEDDSRGSGDVVRARTSVSPAGAATVATLGTDLEAVFGLKDDHAWLDRAARAREATLAAGVLGDYEVLEEIGRGGQGVVYSARQPLTGRVVAIKRAGMLASERERLRFEREVEAAARLSHPNVVTVHGAQVIEGHAVIVMELVQGVAIDRWSEEVRNQEGPGAWRTIVRALEQVCEGVGHAHQRGVIHRDLKPSNILVGADGRPRVLDFGIARVLDPAGGAGATATGFAGTPQFASPEQISGREVDVRTDVYSLGLLLLELVTGVRSFGQTKGLAALMDAIRAGVDPRVSRRVQGVARDLDWVIARATAVDPARRYPTVDAMRRDLRAVAEGGLVDAHPPSVAYALGKSMRRHRVAVAAAVVVGMALAGASLAFWRSAERVERSLAETQAALDRESEAVVLMRRELDIQTGLTNLLQEVLRAGSVGELSADPNMTIREAVDLAAVNTVHSLSLDPEVRAALHAVLGEVYLGMGLYDTAAEHLVTAHERFLSARGPDYPRTLEPLLYLARMTRDRGDLEGALAALERIVHVRRQQTYMDASLDLAQALNSLGITQRRLGMLEDSERSQLEAIELYLAKLEPQHESVGLCRGALATLYVDMGRLQEAVEQARLAVEALDSKNPDTPHIYRASVRRTLGDCLRAQGELVESEAVLREGLAMLDAIAEAPVVDVSRVKQALAQTLLAAGRPAEGIPLLREALAGYESVHPVAAPRESEARALLEQVAHLVPASSAADGAAPPIREPGSGG